MEVYYGMIQAIKGISFEVNQGEVMALIGANGAGKTTTLHTITGLVGVRKKDLSRLRDRILQKCLLTKLFREESHTYRKVVVFSQN